MAASFPLINGLCIKIPRPARKRSAYQQRTGQTSRAASLLFKAFNEAPEIAPEITIEVSTERGEIAITDNVPGLPAETIDGVLDYNVRVSSREAYVSPSRGQQGNVGRNPAVSRPR